MKMVAMIEFDGEVWGATEDYIFVIKNNIPFLVVTTEELEKMPQNMTYRLEKINNEH